MMEPAPPLAGVVGWPISHSLSPRLHRHWLDRYGIPGYYIPIGLKPQDFETAIRAMPKLGFRGVNVTQPYKETVLGMADNVSDRAALIGAANTLVFRDDGGIYVDNTDGYGFIRHLETTAPAWNARNGPALVLGAGGAARAIVSALLTAGVPEMRIANRTRQRSEILRDQHGARVTVVDWNRASEAAADAATIVNTTSLGMEGKPELAFSLDHAPAEAVVVDIVYVPLRTALLERAEARGLTAVDGLGMLFHQAVPGFEAWFHRRPEVDARLTAAFLGK